MKILSYRGFDFEDNDYWIGILFDGAMGQWGVVPQVSPRRNDQGEITGMMVSERPIACEVGYRGVLTFQQAWHTLLGQLNPMDPEPGELVAETNDGQTVSCRALLTMPGAPTSTRDVNAIAVTFLTTDPMWRATTETDEGPASVAKADYGGLTFTVDGHAPVNATVRLTPTAADEQVTVRTFSITNNGTRTMENFPVRVNLGNTYDGSPHTGFYHALLKDGERHRSQLINYYGNNIAYLWMVVDYLPAGQTAEYTLLLSDSYLMTGATFTTYTQPAFATEWASVVAAAPLTTTVTTISGAAYETNEWQRGIIRGLTGANAGVERRITANGAGSITHAAFPAAFTAGDEILLTMSANGDWVYPVRQTERSGGANRRGLWWISRGQKKPDDARFDVPGAWAPYLYYDNPDEKSQKRWTPVANTGGIGPSADYFAILDANRTWEGATTIKEEGGADGVAISMPFPMTSLYFSHQLKNPNSMATFVVGSRAAGGAADFTHEYVNTAASTGLVNYAAQTVTLSADTVQLYLGLIPTTVSNVVADEIGVEWARDDGTATSGTTTQLNDNTKEWIGDQFIGGSVRIVSGTGAGQQRTISDNSPNTITPSAPFTTAPDNTSRYQVRNKKWVATARTDDVFQLTWSTSSLVVSSVTAPVDGYVLDRDLYVDKDTSGAGPPYQRIQFVAGATGRYIVLLSGETFVISGAEMRAWIEIGGVEVRTVPPRAVLVRDYEADGTARLAERWLWLTPGEHTIMVSAKADGNNYDIEATYTNAWFG